jgi:hypothetical protein
MTIYGERDTSKLDERSKRTAFSIHYPQAHVNKAAKTPNVHTENMSMGVSTIAGPLILTSLCLDIFIIRTGIEEPKGHGENETTPSQEFQPGDRCHN